MSMRRILSEREKNVGIGWRLVGKRRVRRMPLTGPKIGDVLRDFGWVCRLRRMLLMGEKVWIFSRADKQGK